MKVWVLLEEPEDQGSISAADVDDCLHVLPRHIGECCEPDLSAGLHRAIEHVAQVGMRVKPVPPTGSGNPFEHVLAGPRCRKGLGEGAVDLAVDQREVTPTGLGVTA